MYDAQHGLDVVSCVDSIPFLTDVTFVGVTTMVTSHSVISSNTEYHHTVCAHAVTGSMDAWLHIILSWPTEQLDI